MTHWVDPSPWYLLLIAVLNLALGVYIFLRNPQGTMNRSFAFFASSLSLWTAALAFGRLYPAYYVPALQLAFAAGSLSAMGVVMFVKALPVPYISETHRSLWVFGAGASVLSVLSFSPWVVSGTRLETYGVQALYGPLHPLFALYLLTCFAYVSRILWEKYRAATGLTKIQIRYVFFAFVVPGLLVTTSNAIVPFLLKTSAYSRYGPAFSLLMLAVIAHAIIRHRLMDTRIVIRQGAVYLAAFAAAGAILVFLLVASHVVFPEEGWFTALEILLALVVAVLFHPLKSRIQLTFDRYLYREPYNYQRIIRETSRALSNTIELPLILECVGAVIRDVFKPEWTAILLLEEGESDFERVWSAGVCGVSQALGLQSAVISRAAASRALIFRDELASVDGGVNALDEMTRLNADVVAPLLEEGRLFGLILAGPKRSGSPYFSDDADLLQTLAHQSAVAIRNAQTHQRVLQVNEELQKTLATIESGVVAVGSRGRISVFNKAAEQLTGRSAESLRGRGIEHLPPLLGRLIEDMLADGQSHSQVEIALPDPAGQMVPLMCTISPLRSPQGALVGAVAVFTDLSRLKELERERRRAERLASLEAIASGMVHEIRNPLVSIKAFTQLLPSRFDDPEFRQNCARVVGREINRMEDLLDRFRMLSTASHQTMEAVDVLVPLDDTLSLIQPQLEGRRITLRRVTTGPYRPVLGNASQLEQLFLNLCLNALEAMDSGGELTIRVADLSQGGGSTLLLEVSDTGCGIPEDMTEQIFNPFVTTKAHGTGLGLAICRAIADAHKAILRARNHTGRSGCTFTVEFPVPSATPSGVPA
jgi:PAS domain S-box-containing protein